MMGLRPPLTQRQIREQFPDTPLTYANHRMKFLTRRIDADLARMDKILQPPGPRPPPTPK